MSHFTSIQDNPMTDDYPNFFNSLDSIDLKSEGQLKPEQKSKILEVLSFIPIAGTIIGIKNAIAAYNDKKPVEAWEKAKIITQIFSFLIVPQIIYGTACALSSFSEFLSSRSTSPVPHQGDESEGRVVDVTDES